LIEYCFYKHKNSPETSCYRAVRRLVLYELNRHKTVSFGPDSEFVTVRIYGSPVKKLSTSIRWAEKIIHNQKRDPIPRT
jgi:hypothetical protein